VRIEMPFFISEFIPRWSPTGAIFQRVSDRL